MHKEYAELSEARMQFWETLGEAYTEKQKSWGASDGTCPEKLHDFSLDAVPPAVKGDVLEYANKKLQGYLYGRIERKRMWELASFVYPERGGVEEVMFQDGESSMSFFEDFHQQVRGKLAWFWDKWMLLLNAGHITKYYSSARQEIYLLVWLELSLAKKIGQPGTGKEGLFKLAREFHM